MAGKGNGKSWIKRRWWVIPAGFVVTIAIAFFIYTSDYYRAEEKAAQYLQSDETVTVSQTDEGWFFDGPSEDTAMIFYPGAKVEETAYAPLLHELAAQEMDAFLVEMPFRIAFFGGGTAADIMDENEYAEWYIGGHSLGGVAAADFAANHLVALEGLVLLASYPTKELDDGLSELSIVGSEDNVINRDALEDSEKFAPADYKECEIAGGNHAGFGMYGAQKGDGAASLTQEEQIVETVKIIGENRRK